MGEAASVGLVLEATLRLARRPHLLRVTLLGTASVRRLSCELEASRLVALLAPSDEGSYATVLCPGEHLRAIKILVVASPNVTLVDVQELAVPATIGDSFRTDGEPLPGLADCRRSLPATVGDAVRTDREPL